MTTPTCRAVLLVAMCASAACGPTEPARFTGTVRTDNAGYTIHEGVKDGVPVFVLSVRASFTNTGTRPVYVHQFCDSPPVSDPAGFEGWMWLNRPLGNPTGIALKGAVCQDSSPSRATRELSPGDSVSWNYNFLAPVPYQITALDTAQLTGQMRVEVVVTKVPGTLADTTQLLPVADRLSPTFNVSFP